MHYLEQAFPVLADALPRKRLVTLPTPVETLLLEQTDTQLWIKRDDLSGASYGGNKVRKLEYLVGAALACGARKIMTFGTAGSNHALATGIYARASGLTGISMLTPQVNARYVARNLRMGLRAGIEFHAYPDDRSARRAVPWVRLRHRIADGVAPYVAAGGGSSALGTVGFVNAGFELRAQIDAGELPEPDYVYVALGTMGTAAGLLIGMRAAGLSSHLVCVRVVHERVANPQRFMRLAEATSTRLHRIVPAMPGTGDDFSGLEFRDEFYGGEYARFTRAGMQAIAHARQLGAPGLEGTYTGKAFAALLHDLDSGRLRGKRVLFWNTYNSRAFPDNLDQEDVTRLPRDLQRYFTQSVQALDDPV